MEFYCDSIAWKKARLDALLNFFSNLQKTGAGKVTNVWREVHHLIPVLVDTINPNKNKKSAFLVPKSFIVIGMFAYKSNGYF